VKPELLIWSGGLFHVAFVVFHLMFRKLFRWDTELAKLTSLNRAVIPVLNISLTVVFVVFAYFSLMHAPEMVRTELGRTLTLAIAIFWYLRAVQQVVFFGLRKTPSLIFFLVVVVGGSLYAAAWGLS
jgi:hypothetical protein